MGPRTPPAWPAQWLVPDWPAPAGVRAVFTTRVGGGSSGPYSGFNLGDHVGDDPACVAAHRQTLGHWVGARPVFLQQVHSTAVVALDAGTQDGTRADACLTADPGLACTIMVADCLPVLLTDRAGTWVAAAHAGWRGLAGGEGRGVLEHVVAAATRRFGTAAGDMLVWLGPCIGRDAFEVGPDVMQAFGAEDIRWGRYFRPRSQGKWMADLSGLARERLGASGVTRIHGNDGSPAWCTVSDPSRFFSHRRDRVSGRMAGLVWRA